MIVLSIDCWLKNGSFKKTISEIEEEESVDEILSNLSDKPNCSKPNLKNKRSKISISAKARKYNHANITTSHSV